MKQELVGTDCGRWIDSIPKRYWTSCWEYDTSLESASAQFIVDCRELSKLVIAYNLQFKESNVHQWASVILADDNPNSPLAEYKSGQRWLGEIEFQSDDIVRRQVVGMAKHPEREEPWRATKVVVADLLFPCMVVMHVEVTGARDAKLQMLFEQFQPWE